MTIESSVEVAVMKKYVMNIAVKHDGKIGR